MVDGATSNSNFFFPNSKFQTKTNSKKIASNDLLPRFNRIALLSFLFESLAFPVSLSKSPFFNRCRCSLCKRKRMSCISHCRGSNPCFLIQVNTKPVFTPKTTVPWQASKYNLLSFHCVINLKVFL